MATLAELVQQREALKQEAKKVRQKFIKARLAQRENGLRGRDAFVKREAGLAAMRLRAGFEVFRVPKPVYIYAEMNHRERRKRR